MVYFAGALIIIEGSAVDKLTKKQMLERLAKFRAAGDQINDDLNSLAERILSIYQHISSKDDRTPEEEEVYRQLHDLLTPILQSALNSHNYTQSMWKDYTQVVKSLGASSDVNSHGD